MRRCETVVSRRLYLIVVCLLLGAFPFGATGCGARRAARDDRAGMGAAGCPTGYVRIEPGTFMMGSPTDERGRKDDETQHSVTITRAYCMKATEVTQGEWQAVMGSNPSEFTSCGANCPVEQVSWEDAVGYANALSRREGLPECYAGSSFTRRDCSDYRGLPECSGGSTFTGLDCRGYRLPTEAEWEYAARAGTTAATYGNLDNVAWYNWNVAWYWNRVVITHAVRQGEQPNAWGLYDMLGNVWEWTGDWYAAYYPGSATDPQGVGAGSDRVTRGGSFYGGEWRGVPRFGVRAAYRSSDMPDAPDDSIGFRLSRTASSGSESVKLGISAATESSSSVPKPADCPAGYVRIAPGTFMMGAPKSEAGLYSDETQHSVGLDGLYAILYLLGARHRDETQQTVTITRAYCMKATEVTQGEWQAVMGSNPSGFKSCGANCPVEMVSWDDAVGYANALSQREGLPECYAGSTFSGLSCKGYRLPTEAEWEYAARAGTTAATYGNLDSVAWYDENSGLWTHPVGQKQPNAWGLYDMLGNVCEWTGDWHGEYSGVSSDPTGAVAGSDRVLRGGSWYYSARAARAADRGGYAPGIHYHYIGFRLSRTAP